MNKNSKADINTRIAGFALLAALLLVLLLRPGLIVGSFLVLIGPWDAFSVTAVTTAGCYLLALYAASVLAEPRKHVVLYLRRFRSVSGHELMGRAIDTGLGRRYRVVTLDDASFRPIGVPKTERRFSVLSSPVMAAGGVLLFVIVMYYLVVRPLLKSAPGPIPPQLFRVYSIAFGQSIWQSPLWPAISGFAFVVFTFLMVHRWRVRRRARLRIRTTRDLDRCTYRVVDLASWRRRPGLLAPQATVIKVVDELWQATVVRLLDHVDAVIVDVSELTENLLWEVRTLHERAFEPCVWIGDARAVAISGDIGESLTATLGTPIKRDSIVTYDPKVRGAERQLRRDLTAALERLRYPAPRNRPEVHIARPLWTVTAAGLLNLVLYGTMALLASVLNFMLWLQLKEYLFRLLILPLKH